MRKRYQRSYGYEYVYTDSTQYILELHQVFWIMNNPYLQIFS